MPQGQVHPIREAYPAALNKEGIATNQLQISASIVRARCVCLAARGGSPRSLIISMVPTDESEREVPGVADVDDRQ